MANDKLQKWALTAEIIGGIAIVISLIFVGLETRQNAEATRAATVLQLKQSWVDLNLMKASSLELVEAIVSLVGNNYRYEGLDLKEKLLIQANVLIQAHNWSNAYYQYRVGMLEQEQWDPLVRDIEGMSKFPHFWQSWDENQHFFDDPFRELVNSRRPSE